MPEHSETVEIARPAADVWQALGRPERWHEGYRETSSRSPDYPAPNSQNDHVFRTRIDENVSVRVARSESPTLLEEDHEGKTFRRHIRYSLQQTEGGTRLTVTDDISFKGLARLATPIAFDDVKRRWKRSLGRLRDAAEAD